MTFSLWVTDILQRARSLLWAGTFARNLYIVTGGNVLAQLLLAGFTPLLARLYGPEHIGVFSVIVAAILVAEPIYNLCYYKAIVLVRSAREALMLVALCLVLGGTLCLVLALLLIPSPENIERMLGVAVTGPSVYLILVIVALGVAVQPLEQMLVRRGRFPAIAAARVGEAAVTGGLSSLAGVILPGVSTLLAGYATGRLVRLLSIVHVWKRRWTQRHAVPPASWEMAAGLVKRYRDFPMCRAPQGLLNAISSTLPVVILASAFGPASAGYYAVARKVVALPISVFSSSMGSVIYPRLAAASEERPRLRRLLVNSTVGLAMAGALPFLLIFVCAPDVFQLLFGREWAAAAEYARWLSLWMYMGFINTPCIETIPVLRLQGYYLAYEIAATGVKSSAVVAAILVSRDDLVAVQVLSLAGAGVNLLLVACVIGAAYRPEMAHPKEGE